MTINLISMFEVFAVVMTIAVLDLIFTQIFINRAAKAQKQAYLLPEQSSGISVDIDDLTDSEKQLDVVIIFNDILENVSHHHVSMKTGSANDQSTRVDQIDNKNMSSSMCIQENSE